MLPRPPAFSLPLAQFNPYEDAPAPSEPPPQRPMSFSDLQRGLRDVHSGKVDDSTFRNGILVLLALLALVVLIIHFRQRHETPAAPPDSLRKLGRELGRVVRFPFGSRLFLKWVAFSTAAPYPALLLSSDLFDQSVAQWSRYPTFAAARSWGRSRLQRLRPVLFG
jgi:hypothetical protein